MAGQQWLETIQRAEKSCIIQDGKIAIFHADIEAKWALLTLLYSHLTYCSLLHEVQHVLIFGSSLGTSLVSAVAGFFGYFFTFLHTSYTNWPVFYIAFELFYCM
jgi:hypothetical protein